MGERLWLRLPLSPILAYPRFARLFTLLRSLFYHIFSYLITTYHLPICPLLTFSCSLFVILSLSSHFPVISAYSPLPSSLSLYLTLSHIMSSLLRIVAPCVSLSFQCLLRAVILNTSFSFLFPSCQSLYLALSQRRLLVRCGTALNRCSSCAKIAYYSRAVSLSKTARLRAICHFFWVSSTAASSFQNTYLAVSE